MSSIRRSVPRCLVWSFFQKRSDRIAAALSKRRYSIGEEVFYRTMDLLKDEVVSDDPREARLRVLEILYAAEQDIFEQTLQPIQGRFARLWYDFMARHDTLPVDAQLPDASLLMARELVMAFAQGSTRTRSLAAKVLQLMDRAFQDGNLALCEVLLELFDAEENTRRSNERNVFFDRYTRRLFHGRRRLLTPREISRFRDILKEELPLEHAVQKSLEWLNNTAGIYFGAYQEDPEMRLRFDALSTSQQDALSNVLRVPMPYERFRALDERLGIALIGQRIAQRMAQRGPYRSMVHTLEAAYFTAVSKGKDESIELLFGLDPWLEHTIGVDSPMMLARIHRAVRKENRLLKDAFDLALNEQASKWVISSTFDVQHITELFTNALQLFEDTDLQVVPEGMYDLEQFIGQLALNQPIRWRLRLCRYI